jgi:hypothetical protein
MPGQLPSAGTEVLAKDYQSVKKAAKDIISALVGKEVTVRTRKNGSMKWKVIASYEPSREICWKILNLHMNLDFMISAPQTTKNVKCW